MVATTTPSSPEQGGNRAGTAHGILIIMAAVMPAMAIISLVPVLPMLEQEFAAIEGSEFLVPVALTIPAFCLAIFSPVAGWLTDRIGRKSLLVGALALYSVLGTAPFFLADLKQIIASRFALGITEALIMTAATTLVGDYFQDARRERWLGIQVSAVSVAAIAMAAISGGLGQAFGARGPFLMYIIALPLAIACQWVLFEPTDKQQATASTTERFPLLRMVPLLLAGLSLGILFYVVLVKLGDILALKTEISPAFVGQMSAITNIGVALGTVVFGVLRTRLAHSTMMAIGSVLIASGYALIPGAAAVPQTVVGASIVCLGSGLLIPTFLTATMDLLSMQNRGRGMGMWQGSFFLGQFVAPVTAVALARQTGDLGTALWVYVGLAAVMGAIFGARSLIAKS